MDDLQFDRLTRALIAPRPRRAALRALAASGMASLAWLGRVNDTAACRKTGKKCKKGKQCCSGKCKGKKCRCARPGGACPTSGNGDACCTANCGCQSPIGPCSCRNATCLDTGEVCAQTVACCTGICQLGKCCLPAGFACTGSGQCCGVPCLGGFCTNLP